MALTNINPSTYIVPTGLALIFEENETFKYKRASGSINTIATSVLSALGVEDTDLPCLVYDTDLAHAIGEKYSVVENVSIALSTKATTNYVRKIANTKVNKATFLSTVIDLLSSVNVDSTYLIGNGKVGSPISLSVETVDALNKAHEHNNKNVLDKLTVDNDNKLLYDGKPVDSDMSNVITSLQSQITALQNTVALLSDRISALEPAGIESTVIEENGVNILDFGENSSVITISEDNDGGILEIGDTSDAVIVNNTLELNS